MINIRRLAAAVAATVVVLLSGSPRVAQALTCNEEIFYGSEWWHLQYECGEQHPQEGCYKEVGGTDYLAFSCSSGTPSMQCNANGCYDVK